MKDLQTKLDALVQVKQELVEQIKLDQHWIATGIGGLESFDRLHSNRAALVAVAMWIAETVEQIREAA